jgi:AbrB family looped-hinge helix DNA binding protein
VAQLASEHGIHPTQLHKWRSIALEGLPALFSRTGSTIRLKARYEEQLEDLYAQLGRVSTHLAWLKMHYHMHYSPTLYKEESMKEHIGVVTRKGQVTLPAEVRYSLGLKQGDKVIFRLQDDQVMVKRTESAVSATAGIFKSDRPALTAEELRVVAEEAISEEVAERSN